MCRPLFCKGRKNEHHHVLVNWLLYRSQNSASPKVIKHLHAPLTQLSIKFQLLIKAQVLNIKDSSCFKALRCCFYPANKRLLAF